MHGSLRETSSSNLHTLHHGVMSVCLFASRFSVNAGEDAVLECVVEQVRPAAKLTWQGLQQEEILNEQIQVIKS